MSAFLSSIRTDLLDRRLLPLVGLVIAGLIAAVGYVAFGGGSSSSSTSANVAPVVAPPSNGGISVSAANDSSEKAVAETTDGLHVQRKGSSRDPFTPLPAEASATTSTTTTAPASGSSGSSSSGSSESSSGSSGSAGGEEKKPKAKPKTVYHVSIKFGSLTPDPATGEVTLTPYVNLKLFTPLPSVKSPLIIFRGVTAAGKSATFTIVGETILTGKGACLPSALECHALDLKPGQSEQFEYLPAGSLVSVSYELQVVSITHSQSTATTASVARASGQSVEGWKYLRNAHLIEIPDLKPSSQAGVLVFAPRQQAKIARAHLAAAGPRLIG